MSKLVVTVEPKGYADLDVNDMVGDEYVFHLLVEGSGDIPVPECSEIELLIYQAHGYELHNMDEFYEFTEESEDYIPVNMDEWCAKAIEWYEQRGFTAERIGLELTSGLG